MSAVATEEVELENVLQQVFMECDASMSVSTPDSMVSVSEEMPISRIIDYIQDQLPTWSIDNLMELWKYLVAVSTNDRVNFRQFKEATKCWIAKMQQIQSSQDGNNNAREKLPLVSDTDSSMKTVDVNGHIMEFELRVKLRELHEENILLRDELERHEGSIENLKQQCGIAEKQLDRYVQKCHQLEKENDEQRDQLNEAIKKEKVMALALQRFTKEHQNMIKQLETAEIEMQVIPSLKDKMEKINKEKMDCIKQIAKLQEAFDEREDECKQLKGSITELENTSIDMREMYEYTICNLREKNRQLSDENTELQSLSALNGCSGERLLMSPISDTDGCYTHSTPFKVEKAPLQNSLYAELKALGFTAEYRKDPHIQELEEELDEYDTAISTISEQLEKIVQIFATIRGSTYDAFQFNPQDTDPRTYNIEALKHKVAFLLNVASEEMTRRETKDSSTQLRADSINASDDLIQFGVRSFRDLPTRALPYPKVETDLRSITSHSVNTNKDDHDDIFLRVIKTYAGIQNHFRIIEPIIEELHDIIESTVKTLNNRKDCSSFGSSRYRSIHTLSSNAQSPQPSSLIAEDSRQQISGSCQTPITNSLDVSLARGDGLMRESHDEKSASLATALHNISDQENLARLEGHRSSDMSKVSSVQMNSKALTISEEKKTNAKSFQVPEVSSASNPASPRRKISVYCRSFDVVAVQDSHEDRQGSSLEVRRSLSNPDNLPALLDQRIDETDTDDRNSTFKYPFNHCYRNAKNDSDSSNGSTPQKQFRDSLLDDEPPVEQPILRKVYLAPTRLKFPQEVKSELNRTASDCVSPIADSTASDISNSISFTMDNGREKNEDDAAVHSSLTFVVNKRETEVKSAILGFNSCSTNENSPQGHLMPAHRLISPNQTNSARIADSKDPHSQASVQRVSDKSQPRVERSVDSQMSSREDSSAGSDNECETTAGSIDRCIGEKDANEPDGASSTVSSTPSLGGLVSTPVVPYKNVIQNDGKTYDKDLMAKQERRQRLLIARRTLSEGEDIGRSDCRCKQRSAPLIPEENQRRIFPSLTNIRLQESGIANLSDTELDSWENLSELELQKRYTAFSLCLCIDRVTLPRRVAMSLRQRDQSERNLSCEVQKMQQDIQELAPLCTDRESVERVERVRHQLDMIVRCAHRVSCVAETLGAVHQESRISRAVLLTDRYLRMLQSRCEKLVVNIAEAKRILTENNIVIEENSGELGDDVPRIRYRSGTPANNRMMMARRRASIAAISRPMGSTQDVTKDVARQRNSVSGRMTLRRPSLSSESPKSEAEKLDRTESSSSIGELRGIFEQTESRRSSREENNNMLRSSHSNSQTIINYAMVDNEIWMNAKQEISPELVSANENTNPDGKPCAKLSQSFQFRSTPWRTMLWSIIIFFLGFFVNQAISVVNVCSGPSNNWSFEHIFGKYVQTRNTAPHPM